MGSSTNMESGRSGSAGRETTRAAEFFEELFVGAMLRAGDLQIDGLARNEA